MYCNTCWQKTQHLSEPTTRFIRNHDETNSADRYFRYRSHTRKDNPHGCGRRDNIPLCKPWGYETSSHLQSDQKSSHHRSHDTSCTWYWVWHGVIIPQIIDHYRSSSEDDPTPQNQFAELQPVSSAAAKWMAPSSSMELLHLTVPSPSPKVGD